MATTWQDVLDQGFANYVSIAGGGPTDPAGFALLVKDHSGELQRALRASDSCRLAFEGMIIRPEIRVPCLVMVLEDRVILVWKKGIFKKTSQSEVIPRDDIESVEIARGDTRQTGDARVLSIQYSRGTTRVALATDLGAVAEREIYRQVIPISADLPVEPSASESEWKRTASGLFVQESEGIPSGSTYFVNPLSSKETQIRQLYELDWLPASVMRDQVEQVNRGSSFEIESALTGRLLWPVSMPSGVEIVPGVPWASSVASYLWPSVNGAGQLDLEPGEKLVSTWASEAAKGYWVRDDLMPALGFALVSDRESYQFSWSLTSRRLVCVFRMPSSLSGIGGMQIRFEWICGVNIETYDYLGNRENTTSLSVVCGEVLKKRLAVCINPGNALDSEAVGISHAVQKELLQFGLTAGEVKERKSDNGKKGVLKFLHFPVTGGTGMTMPATVV